MLHLCTATARSRHDLRPMPETSTCVRSCGHTLALRLSRRQPDYPFQHQSRWPFGRLLAEQLARHLLHAFDEGLPRPSALLPVPLARKRLRQRGFNQATMLADWLSPVLEIPVRNDLLQRIHDTPSQQQLDAAARHRNLRRAFALPDPQPLRGQHWAIIDDVLTTGATAEALARLLKRAGATRVDIYCLARTPKPGD